MRIKSRLSGLPLFLEIFLVALCLAKATVPAPHIMSQLDAAPNRRDPELPKVSPLASYKLQDIRDGPCAD